MQEIFFGFRGTGLTRVLRSLAVLLLVLLTTAGAFAHASLVSTEPSDGAVVASPPGRLALTFSEPVSPLVLKLVLPDGAAVDLDDISYSGNTLSIRPPAALGNGTHVLSWRVVSEDGHPVGGSVVFSVGAPSAMPGQDGEAVDWTLRILIWTAKLALYLGLALGTGGAFAVAWFGRGNAVGADISAAFVTATIVAVLLSAGFQGLDALGAPLARFGDLEVWRTGLRTSFGITAIGLFLACAAALLSLAFPTGTTARLLSLAALLVAAGAVAASGHAGSASPRWLTRPLVAVHVAAMAAWIGALAPLGLAWRREAAGMMPFLMRFSRMIPWIVAGLFAAGLVLSVIQVETPAALLATPYGRVLSVKLALVGLLLCLAAFNRWRLTPAIERGEAASARVLARSIVVELLIAVLIFGAVAAWRFTPPPRALAVAAAVPATVHIHDARAMADVVIAPGAAGPVTAMVSLQSGDFGPLAAKEVTLVFSMPDAGIEPLRRPAVPSGDGQWRVDDLVLPLAGTWSVRVDVLISDFEIVKLEGEVRMRP